MKLFAILECSKPAPQALPGFIRDIEDIRGVRVLRLRGSVGKEIAAEARAAQGAAARSADVFSRPLLFDFKDTTGSDFATLGYLVGAIRNRMAAGAQVGIINAPPQLVAELSIAKIETLVRVFASEQQALDDLGAQAPGNQSR